LLHAWLLQLCGGDQQNTTTTDHQKIDQLEQQLAHIARTVDEQSADPPAAGGHNEPPKESRERLKVFFPLFGVKNSLKNSEN
jgi:hypothetical protein